MTVHLFAARGVLHTACGKGIPASPRVRQAMQLGRVVGDTHYEDVTCQDCRASEQWAEAERAGQSEDPPLPDPRPAS